MVCLAFTLPPTPPGAALLLRRQQSHGRRVAVPVPECRTPDGAPVEVPGVASRVCARRASVGGASPFRRSRLIPAGPLAWCPCRSGRAAVGLWYVLPPVQARRSRRAA